VLTHLNMKNLITLVSTYPYLRLGHICKLEKRSKHNFTLAERIFLVHLGPTQQLLEILSKSRITFEVINHEEKENTIRRDVKMFVKKSKVLVMATSHIYKAQLPLNVLKELRLKNSGIGAILLKHNVATFRRIRKIGYNKQSSSVFRIYEILHNGNVLAQVNETFLTK
jgi:chorismate-pyruvate lyase